jgi:hypothetical protein
MAGGKAAPSEGSEKIVPTDYLEAAASWLTLWRALFFDLPLIWTMELSRFASREVEEQIGHYAALVGCTDLRGLIDEQARFARQSTAELGDEVEALAKEARIAVAA